MSEDYINFCDVCNIKCLGVTLFAAHLKSERHIKKVICETSEVHEYQKDKEARLKMQFYCQFCDVNAKLAMTYQEHITGYKHAINEAASDVAALQRQMQIKATMTELNAGHEHQEPPLHEQSFADPTKDDGGTPSLWEERVAEVMLTLKLAYSDLIEFFPGKLTDLILQNVKVRNLISVPFRNSV